MSRSWRGSQSGFPLLTPNAHFRGLRDGLEYNFFDCIQDRHQLRNRNGGSQWHGRTRMWGGRHRENVYAACRGYVVVLVLYYFDDSSTSTRCLYLSPSQLCLIKRIGTSYARAHAHPHAHPRPRAYACGRTLAARSSRQTMIGGGGDCPCRLCPVRNV